MFNDVTTEMVAQAFSAWYYYTGQREKNSPQKQNTTTKPLQGKTCEGFSIARKYVSIGEVRGMPRKTLKPCKYPGCPNLTDSQFCPEHRKKADRDYNRFYRDPAHKERYHTAAWHTIRAVQLVRYPLCEMCMAEGRYVKATLVHHRVPLAEGGTNAPENLCNLCASHHTALHNNMRRDAGGNGAAE